MTMALDTSVVVRLLIGEPQAQAAVAKRWIDSAVQAGGGPLRLSDLVVGESYFALRHHYAVPHAKALHALRLLVADHRFGAEAATRAVLRDAQSAAARPGFMDRLIHQQYRADGLNMATFDRHAARLPGVSLLTQTSA